MSASVTLNIEARIPGQRRFVCSDYGLALAATADTREAPTVREVLTAIVRHEVEAFHERQERNRLTRVLLPEAIARGAERGKIVMGGQDEHPQQVSSADAVAAALRAFEDHLFLAVLDGTQLDSLDQPVVLREGSYLLFVRLVALVGG